MAPRTSRASHKINRGRTQMAKKVQERVQESPETKAMLASINAVYSKYGTDLSAFYRDIREKIVKSQGTSTDSPLKKSER
jgi:hypothetical protein